MRRVQPTSKSTATRFPATPIAPTSLAAADDTAALAAAADITTATTALGADAPAATEDVRSYMFWTNLHILDEIKTVRHMREPRGGGL